MEKTCFLSKKLLNISGVLLILFFIFVDLLFFHIKQAVGQHYQQMCLKLVWGGLLIFIIMANIYYGGRIAKKFYGQYVNVRQGKIFHQVFPEINLEELKTATHYSSKLYFISNYDSVYYYLGNYVPQGYYLPYSSWIFKKDLLFF